MKYKIFLIKCIEEEVIIEAENDREAWKEARKQFNNDETEVIGLCVENEV
ncbi:hypothetical protein [Burkholderia contaminans]|nr:hypothetical protein [Burkholderia contaminans]